MDAPDLAPLRHRFPALARTGPDGRPVVFADAPGGSQAPDNVIEAIAGRLRAGSSNTHGAFATSREIDELIAEAHRVGADFLGVEADEVVFGPNSTTLLLHLSRSFARTLRAGDDVIVTRLDHDANIRPWVLAAADAGATVRWVDLRTADASLDDESFERAVTERTRLVAFTLASNGVGTIPRARDLVRRAKEVGAIVALDGVHMAQHRSIDLRALGADIVATSPYKFFGPHLGMLGVRRTLLETWEPYKLRPASDAVPDRWETGTQNHEGLAGTIAAIEYIAEVGRMFGEPRDASRRAAIETGFRAFAAHERRLTARFLEGLARIPRARLYGIADMERIDERTPTFAVRVGTQHPLVTAERLGRQGIFVWDGHYYAIELFERLGLLGAGGAVRIGFCHYHTTEEVERVLAALEELAATA